MITIDCYSLTGPSQLHDAIAGALDFPEYYGCNLDALYDCLTELPQQTAVRLLGCDQGRFPGFAETFRDAAEENPLLRVLFE